MHARSASAHSFAYIDFFHQKYAPDTKRFKKKENFQLFGKSKFEFQRNLLQKEMG